MLSGKCSHRVTFHTFASIQCVRTNFIARLLFELHAEAEVIVSFRCSLYSARVCRVPVRRLAFFARVLSVCNSRAQVCVNGSVPARRPFSGTKEGVAPLTKTLTCSPHTLACVRVLIRRLSPWKFVQFLFHLAHPTLLISSWAQLPSHDTVSWRRTQTICESVCFQTQGNFTTALKRIRQTR